MDDLLGGIHALTVEGIMGGLHLYQRALEGGLADAL